MLSEITQNPLLTGILGAIGGGLITWLIQQIQNKRGSFSYIVTHNQLAYSANDIVFGNVTVQWNGRNINNLYLSKIEITNESMNDYEDVVLSTYSSGTELLTEQTGIIGTPLVLKWSDNYSELVKVPNGGTPTDSQWSIYKTQREYIVPVINRGQVATISYLNEVNDITTRGIWVTATKRGVKLKERKPHSKIHGIEQPRAALVGILLGFFLIPLLISTTQNAWYIASLVFVYGLVAQTPGAYVIKTWRFIREVISG